VGCLWVRIAVRLPANQPVKLDCPVQLSPVAEDGTAAGVGLRSRLIAYAPYDVRP